MFTFIKNILNNMFGTPATRLYPFVKREPIAGSRSHLKIDPATCIYCGICAKRCPSMALKVSSKEPKSWALDPYRCILCGYCVEVCPKKCLHMDPDHAE